MEHVDREIPVKLRILNWSDYGNLGPTEQELLRSVDRILLREVLAHSRWTRFKRERVRPRTRNLKEIQSNVRGEKFNSLEATAKIVKKYGSTNPHALCICTQAVSKFLQISEQNFDIKNLRGNHSQITFGDRIFNVSGLCWLQVQSFYWRFRLLALLYLFSFNDEFRIFAKEELHTIFLEYLNQSYPVEVRSTRLNCVTPRVNYSPMAIAVEELTTCPYFSGDVGPQFQNSSGGKVNYNPRSPLSKIYLDLIRNCAKHEGLKFCIPKISQWWLFSRSPNISASSLWQILDVIESAFPNPTIAETMIVAQAMHNLWIHSSQKVEERRKFILGFWYHRFDLILKFATFLSTKKIESLHSCDWKIKFELFSEYFRSLNNQEKTALFCLTILSLLFDRIVDRKSHNQKGLCHQGGGENSLDVLCDISVVNAQQQLLSTVKNNDYRWRSKKQRVAVNKTVLGFVSFLGCLFGSHTITGDHDHDIFVCMWCGLSPELREGIKKYGLWTHQIGILREQRKKTCQL